MHARAAIYNPLTATCDTELLNRNSGGAIGDEDSELRGAALKSAALWHDRQTSLAAARTRARLGARRGLGHGRGGWGGVAQPPHHRKGRQWPQRPRATAWVVYCQGRTRT